MSRRVIVISIKPEYVADILNGEKVLEIRKHAPKCKLPIDVYIYCTLDKKHGLYWTDKWVCVNQKDCVPSVRNGKIVAKFTLNTVEEYPYVSGEYDKLIGSCLSEKELLDYSTVKYENGIRFVKTIYAWHIDNLQIFEKPLDFENFLVGGKIKKGVYRYTTLKKAPQSYCFAVWCGEENE